MSEWQPIDTAPKDGTRVLVAYDPRPAYPRGQIAVAECLKSGDWFPVEGGCETDPLFNVTHWRSLPEPPQ